MHALNFKFFCNSFQMIKQPKLRVFEAFLIHVCGFASKYCTIVSTVSLQMGFLPHRCCNRQWVYRNLLPISQEIFRFIKVEARPIIPYSVKNSFDSCRRFHSAILNNDESNLFVGESCLNSHSKLQVCSFKRCEKPEFVNNLRVTSGFQKRSVKFPFDVDIVLNIRISLMFDL